MIALRSTESFPKLDIPIKRQPLQEWAQSGFENGQQVAIVWPEPAPSTPPERVIECLLDAGIQIPADKLQLASRAIEGVIDDAAIEQAAQVFATILHRLPKGRDGRKLRQALLGTLGEGVDAAAEAGVSKQSWFKSVERLRNRILGHM
jgi:hypothetical protein